MSYEVNISTQAAKSIARLPRREQLRVIDRLDALADDPRPSGVAKLQGVEGYRIRVGDYRIVYTVDDGIRVVSVTNVGHRREIHRRKR